MKLDKNKLANTFALAMAVLWVLCSLVIWILPEFSLQATTQMMHGMNFSAMGSWNLTFGNFLWGGTVAVIFSWVTGWVLGWSWETLYDRK
ncbi:MAG: DUF5676 family membrane protein [bacterium]|nr:DUF5676 family membrane protein [bacterium]